MKLKQGMKRILDALAYQDAGDYLSYKNKLAILGVNDAYHHRSHEKIRHNSRVALLTDGDDEALHYAMEICSHREATLDVVMHGKALVDLERRKQINDSITKFGIPHHPVHLPGDTLSALADYVNNQTNLLYLISSVSNPLARTLSQKDSSHRLRTPVVLFDAQRDLQECAA